MGEGGPYQQGAVKQLHVPAILGLQSIFLGAHTSQPLCHPCVQFSPPHHILHPWACAGWNKKRMEQEGLQQVEQNVGR